MFLSIKNNVVVYLKVIAVVIVIVYYVQKGKKILL